MDWAILRKYVEGECSKKEQDELSSWLQKSSANEDFFSTFIEEWGEVNHIQLDTDARLAWEKFRNNNIKTSVKVHKITDLTKDYKSSNDYSNINKKRNRSAHYWFYSAAAVIILIVAFIFVVQQQKIKIMNAAAEKDELVYKEITTGKGQRTNLWLSDGTHVTLNSESKLRIPPDFGKNSRALYLEGEAFFDVIHDDESPFFVMLKHSYVKDLGTQFNVEAYNLNEIEVAVKEGLVSMGKMKQDKREEETIELEPNMLGTLKKDRFFVSDISNIERYTGWKEGKLIFDKTPFPKVVKRLERWFDIDCRIQSAALNKRTLTATYTRMPLDQVLIVVSLSMNISYRRKNGKIIFQPKS